ncbi:hypothetical protein EJB05_09414, partial [Eragrostis curvula]
MTRGARWESAPDDEAPAIWPADDDGRPHRGASVRTGSTVRNFWNSRAGREPPWRPDRCLRDGASSVCPGGGGGWWPSSLAPSSDEMDDVRVLSPAAPADGELARRLWAPSASFARPGAGWMAKPMGARAAAAGEVRRAEVLDDRCNGSRERRAVWMAASYLVAGNAVTLGTSIVPFSGLLVLCNYGDHVADLNDHEVQDREIRTGAF